MGNSPHPAKHSNYGFQTGRGLTIENGIDRVALYGSFDLTRDKQGLASARALAALLNQAIQLLEADKALPDAVPPPAAPRTVKNPFE